MSSPNLYIERVGRESAVILSNLCQHYVHDMSEWFGNDTLPDGSFAYDLERWWADRHVYLASCADALVGFAVVGNADALGEPAGHDMSEFFVLRKYRRAGAGRMLARHVWQRHPGEWLVRVLGTNVPAVGFWRRTVAESAGARHREESRTASGRDWVFLRFSS